MAKVSDMLKGHDLPQGSLGYSVDTDLAIQIAGEMRRILNLDLDEVDIATQVEIYNQSVDSEEMIAACMHLNAAERRQWKHFVKYDEWLKNENEKRNVD